MKKVYLLLLTTFCCHLIIGQNVIKKQTSLIIPFTSFSIDAATKYDLNDKGGALAFVKNVILKDAKIQADNDFSQFQNDGLENSAMIFLRHGFDANAYKPSMSDADIESLKKSNDGNRTQVKNINEMLLSLQYDDSISLDYYKSMVKVLNDHGNESASFLGKDVEQKHKKPQIKNILTQSLTDIKKQLQDDIDKNKKTIEENSGGIIETDEIVKMVLHKENDESSDYLLGTKKILVIILGGDKDLQQVEIEIKHNKNALSQSWSDLLDLGKKIITGGGIQTLKCKVMLINSDEIKPPSDLLIKHSSFKEDIKFVIHEKAWAQFHAGVSFNQVDKKYLTINNNQLSVNLDSAGKAQWKTNVVALFDFYPFGRDLDRFESIWKKSVPLQQRLGLFGGIRISKDPLEGFYYGVSLALIKNMTINIGGTSMLEETKQTIDISNIASLDDAKQLLNRKYSKPKFFIGISFAPSDLKKIIFGDN